MLAQIFIHKIAMADQPKKGKPLSKVLRVRQNLQPSDWAERVRDFVKTEK